MIIQKSIWKPSETIVIYRQILQIGGIAVLESKYKNTNQSDNHFNVNLGKLVSEFDSKVISKILESHVYLSALDRLIETKSNEFLNFTENEKDIEEKGKWLRDWLNTTKKHVFSAIFQALFSSKIHIDKLDNLKSIVKSYQDYFHIIEKEDDDLDRYEEMFNTLIQIPTEVMAYLKIVDREAQATFIQPKTYKGNKLQIKSSINMDSGLDMLIAS